MANYKGRRPGTRRIVIWNQGHPQEWIIEGTKQDGERFEASKKLELEAQSVERRVVPTFSEFCKAEYRAHAKAHLKDSTWRKVRTYQVTTLIEHFGPLKLNAITLTDIERFKRNRLSEVGASSINNELRILKTIRNYANELGYTLPKLKFKRVPVRGDGRVKVWTPDEIGRIYDATRARYPLLLPMFIFLANTGCRHGEALAAEWSWVDMDHEMLCIPSNEYWQPKNGKPREVPLMPPVRAMLQGLPTDKRWLFPNRAGGRYKRFPKDIWWEILEAAKVDGVPHMFRHTFASHFLQATRDLFLLAQVLGHSHSRVTELYSHLLPGHLERARNAVNLAPTMAATVAASSKTTKTPKKTAKRH
jgi:integrase